MINLIILILFPFFVNSAQEINGMIFQINDDSLGYKRVTTIKVTSTRENEFSYIYINPSHTFGIDSAYDSVFSKTKIGKYKLKSTYRVSPTGRQTDEKISVYTMTLDSINNLFRSKKISKRFRSLPNWWEAIADSNNIKNIPLLNYGDIISFTNEKTKISDTMKVIGFDAYGIVAARYKFLEEMTNSISETNPIFSETQSRDIIQNAIQIISYDDLVKRLEISKLIKVNRRQAQVWEGFLFVFWKKYNTNYQDKYLSDLDDLEYRESRRID